MEPYEEDELSRALKEMINIDKDLESTKQMLSLKTDFNIEDCYRIFDVDAKGYISLRELEEGYNLYKIYPQKAELELLMKKYDIDEDGKLKFQEFTNIIVPKDKNYAALLLTRKPYNAHQEF